MAKEYYLPDGDNARRAFLNHFAARLGPDAAAAGVTAAEVASVQADAAYFGYLLDQQGQYKGVAQEWTTYKNILRDGPLGTVITPPAAIVPPAAPPAPVAPGIFARLTLLVQRIKNTAGVTDAILKDLGIEGADQSARVAQAIATAKPALGVQTVAGHPTIKWKKGDFDALEIQVDRADGKGFVFLAIDTQPDYPDTTPLPAAGTVVIWKYRAIYRKSDEQVGDWSDVLEVTVKGV